MLSDKLQVKKADAPRAIEIIKEIRAIQKDANKPIFINKKKFEPILDDCPKCNSDRVYYEHYGFFKRTFSSFKDRKYYCADCKNTWTEKN